MRFNYSHRWPVYAFSITTCNKTHSSYQIKLQKEVKSTQKQPNCKKRCSPCQKTAWKKLWNQRWQPRSGCDGRIMAKFLITTIQVNLVPISSEVWRRQHKIAWIVVIKNFAIILPSQPLLGRHLWFCNFFMLSLLAWTALFYSWAVFV